MCKVRTVSNFTFHNLHSLDLSDNLLTNVSADQFVHMPHLSSVFFVANPLASVFISRGSDTELGKISTLDLSNVKMQVVDPSLLTVFPNLHTLNLSGSGVQLLRWNSSKVSLRVLDLRGCFIEEIRNDVLRGFLHLRILFTDNFKLCCPSVLPPGFDLNYCNSVSNEVSSCDSLLGSVTYRATVSVLATLALIGNVGSLILRVCIGCTWQLSSSAVVLTHLSVADLGMGLYLVTLGLADRLLAGHYVWQDDIWRQGPSVTWRVSLQSAVDMLPPSSSLFSLLKVVYTTARFRLLASLLLKSGSCVLWSGYLVSSLLRCRYYRNGSFLDSKPCVFLCLLKEITPRNPIMPTWCWS